MRMPRGVPIAPAWRYVAPALLVVVLAFLCIQPIHRPALSLTIIALALLLLAWLAHALRRRPWILAVAAAVVLLLATMLFNRAPIDGDELRRVYVGRLASFAGTRYVWGGEGRLGIDCSGLVRAAMIESALAYAGRHWNGTALLAAGGIWWGDASARELLAGYAGRTRCDGRAYAINDLRGDARAGDLAVTANGLHVLAYLSPGRIIQADPDRGLVAADDLPATSAWCRERVLLVRWRLLDGDAIRP